MQEDENACAHIRNLFIITPSKEEIKAHYEAELSYGNEDIGLTIYKTLANCVKSLQADRWAREDFTSLALTQSLCPLHLIDYAICFDDDDQECAAIRIIHPSHDT